MIKKSTIIIIFISALFVLSNFKVAVAQYFDSSQVGFWSNTSLNVNGGATLFFGDISQGTSPFQDDWKYAYGVNLRKQFTPFFGIGFQFINGNLHGTKLTWDDNTNANLIFDSKITSLNLHAIINFSNIIFGYKPERKFSFYGVLGLGVTNYASLLKNTVTNAEVLSGYNTNNSPPTPDWTPELTIPMGIGAQMLISSRWGINVEALMNRVNSDNIDAYPGGVSKNDYYSYFSLGVTYNLSGVGGLFRKSGDKEKKFSKEQKKLEKWKAREERKNKKRTNKLAADADRKKEIEQAKKDRKERKANFDGMPKVVEYDAIYTEKMASTIKKEKMAKFGDANEILNTKKDTILISDYNIISGVVKPLKGQVVPKTQNPSTSFTSNIINTKSELSELSTPLGAMELPQKGIIYTVQILASSIPAKNLQQTKQRYNIRQQLYFTKAAHLYRYSAGLFNTFAEAQNYANQLKRMGLSDAFVTIYNNGRRIYKQAR